jgi:cell shape-determining protein MreC
VQELNLKMSEFENLKMENEAIKKQNAELIKRIEKLESQ